ncbi:hypothetical protein CLHUN_20100 [Ruminiclostridium hungatei]|uniref:Uncharacterized protein n=1 Tax=Ruminiclostridium hungatei TaxID=48256 RepID=A0A1V4SKH9_RUMHU|nr:hypothetical protein [Ruminiclostridium hungatei]OPX43985.1 hypothetical protein CLHUN_20100 [Ruminiclostridium hungatei]
MTVSDIIKKIAGQELKKYDFKFDCKQGAVRWVFSRNKFGIMQYITFQKSNLMDALRVEFTTSINSMPVLGSHLINSIDYWLSYNDEISLEKVINDLVSIIISEGILCLDAMSTPDIEPSIEMAEELIINTHKKAEDFAARYILGYVNIYDSLKKVEIILQNTKDKTLDENFEILVGAAAYVGEFIIMLHGGSWEWDTDFNTCYLKNIGNTEYFESLITWIINYWHKPEMKIYSLVWKYSNLKEIISE